MMCTESPMAVVIVDVDDPDAVKRVGIVRNHFTVIEYMANGYRFASNVLMTIDAEGYVRVTP